ncbi:MAG: SDR family NAD(P)-dependent oxidoreductase [Gammaproteobacteria bacterium]|nr:SDR family NAD(P)-dependent oxidoreductase [Gammaproteobacteria bacterium]
MKIEGGNVLVTGANRGLGKAFVEELLARGAAMIHASGRDLESLETVSALDRDRIRPVALDVTDAVGIEALAADTPSLDVLINNAGVDCPVPVVGGGDMADLRRAMEVNYFGVLNMSRAFAPVLARSPSSAIINVGSMAGFIHVADNTGYSAAKAAQLMLSQGLRGELAGQGTRVMQVLPGFIDTDMGARFPMPKASARSIAAAVLDALDHGEDLILPDVFARMSYDAFVERPEAVMREPAAVIGALVQNLLAPQSQS